MMLEELEDIKKELDKLIEEYGDTAIDSTIEITAKFINIMQKVNLTESQVDICYKLKSKTGAQLFDDLLKENAITKDKLSKINGYANFATKFNDIVSFAGNVADILGFVKDYIGGDEVSATAALSTSLRTLSDAVGLFTSCNFVSSILSLGADILEKGAELVAQRNKYYEELDAILDDVINGTSTSEQEDLIIDIYKSFKLFERSGSFEAMKLYNAIMTEYGWMFALAGVDMAKLNQYNVEFREIRDAYSDMSSKMYDAERIDRNLNGFITQEEIKLNVEEVKNSEKAEKYDPLILDLNRNGKYTSDAVNGVHFDYSGDGFAEKTAWVESGDGLLVYDKNGNGIIDDGNELFGDKTVMHDGTVAANGFSALKDFDSNGDGKINSDDEQFKQFQVWMDLNNDGVSQKGELFSLSELGIKELSLNATNYNKEDENGNVIARKSSVTYEDGTVGGMAELNFDIISEDTVLKTDIEISDDIKNNCVISFNRNAA